MTSPEQPKPLESKIKSWQAILDLLKSGISSGLLVLFLVYPAGIWFLLGRAGLDLEEINVFGSKVKKKAAESTVELSNALKDAQISNEILKKNLSAAKVSMIVVNDCFSSAEKLATCARDKDLLEQLVQQQSEISQAKANAQKSITAIEKTLSTNAKSINAAEKLVAPQDGRWGIVFGGDTSEDAARDEIKRAQTKNVSSLAIYFRQGSYRSVAMFGNKEEATRALGSLRGINAGAYVVELTTWCPSPKSSGRTSSYQFIECDTQ